MMTTSEKTIRLKLTHRGIQISNLEKGLQRRLCDRLSVEFARPVSTTAGAADIIMSSAEVFEEVERVLYVPIGFLNDVQAFLTTHNQTFVVDDRRNWPAPLIPASNNDPAPDSQDILQTAIRQESCLVLTSTNAFNRLSLAATILRTYPQAPALVVSPRRSEVREAIDYLRQHFPGQIATADSDIVGTLPGREIFIGTHTALTLSSADTYLLLIFLDARAACAQGNQGFFRRLGAHRLFGFVHPDQQLSARDRLWLQAWIGPIFRSSVAAPVPTIGVLWLQSAPHTASGLKGRERKQYALWNNEGRNRSIAAFANALTSSNNSDDPSAILAQRWLLAPSSTDLRVAILVENETHGQILLHELAGWNLLTRQQIQASMPARLNRFLITQMAALSLKSWPIDVLIRADGDSGPLPFPWAGNNGCRSLLVDIDDGGILNEARRQRAKAYASAGWTMLNGNGGHSWRGRTKIQSHRGKSALADEAKKR